MGLKATFFGDVLSKYVYMKQIQMKSYKLDKYDFSFSKFKIIDQTTNLYSERSF